MRTHHGGHDHFRQDLESRISVKANFTHEWHTLAALSLLGSAGLAVQRAVMSRGNQ